MIGKIRGPKRSKRKFLNSWRNTEKSYIFFDNYTTALSKAKNEAKHGEELKQLTVCSGHFTYAFSE